MRTPRSPRGRARGFTLIELLIAVALMCILLAAVTMIFAGTTETVATQEARMTCYANARYALDIMENDLMGCYGVNSGQPIKPLPKEGYQLPPLPTSKGGAQRFWMENGVLVNPGMNPSYNLPGGHTDKAGDRICFRTTTGVGTSLQTVEVTYYLMPGNMALDQQGNPTNGDQSHKQTVRTQRGLYTLVRKIMTHDPKDPDPTRYTLVPTVKDPATGSMIQAPAEELCHYVVGFNIEYFAQNQTYSQLDPSPCPSSNPITDQVDSQGNPMGPQYRIPSLRVTLDIVEDVGERQERIIQKVMAIPMM
jgi:prepilin-type N-terminal cleavage/methylation domain-containing protein